jgi:tRNA (mo5U34)-methyltransferase
MLIKRLIAKIARRVLRSVDDAPVVQELPLNGFTDHRLKIEHVERLSDEELGQLNKILRWRAFVVDSNGRRFGNRAWAGKRVVPQAIPDSRHVLLDEKIPLAQKSILEIGCFEGIHTVSLCRMARAVIAIDSRVENVVKTIVRAGMFGETPTVFKCNVEAWDVPLDQLKADVCHHIGVLYHLHDPVAHLQKLLPLINDAIFLDTHIARPDDQLTRYQSSGKEYQYRFYQEGGKADVFSGMYDHAKWLLLDDLKSVLSDAGFGRIEVIEERDERNGPRILLLAQR